MTTKQTNNQQRTIYVNMFFDKIAEDVNGENTQLVPTFDGKGRSLIYLLPSQEPTFLYYSEDKTGNIKIKSPFDFENNSQVEFVLQAANGSDEPDKKKWKNINQSYYNLQLIEGEKSTYNIELPSNLPSADVQSNAVTFTIHFKLADKKYAVTWDPAVIIVKH